MYGIARVSPPLRQHFPSTPTNTLHTGQRDERLITKES